MDRWFDRQIDRFVDRKLDGLLKGNMPDDEYHQLKVMTKKGQPLDAATEERLQEQLGDLFEPYESVHKRCCPPQAHRPDHPYRPDHP